MFGLKELLKFLDVDDVKAAIMEHSVLVLQCMFNKYQVNESKLNDSEKMLVRLYFELYYNLTEKFEMCRSHNCEPFRAPILAKASSCDLILPRQKTYGDV